MAANKQAGERACSGCRVQKARWWAGGRVGGQASGQAYGRAGAEAHLKPRFKLGVLEPLIDPPLEQLRIEEELRLLEQRLDKLGDGPRAAPRLLDDDHVAAAAMVRPKRVGNRL